MRKLLTLLIGLVCGLLLAEAAIRLADLAPPVATLSLGRFRLSKNLDIGYEPIPNFEVTRDPRGFEEFRGRSNSLGFRDREHVTKKPAGTYRIAVIGDGISMGLGVERLLDIFPVVLEKGLGTAGKKVEVLNFGVSGYNTQQKVATLIGKGVTFAPDLVLLQVALNDWQRDDGGIVDKLKKLEKASRGYDASLFARSLNQSALVRYLRYGIFGENLDARRRKLHQSLERLYEDTVEVSLQRLAQTAKARGLKVLVVAFPGFSRDRRSPDLPQRYRALAGQYTRLQGLSEKLGFLFLDLRDAFRDCAPTTRRPLGSDIFGPTVAGHACAATAIEEYLLGNRIIP